MDIQSDLSYSESTYTIGYYQGPYDTLRSFFEKIMIALRNDIKMPQEIVACLWDKNLWFREIWEVPGGNYLYFWINLVWVNLTEDKLIWSVCWYEEEKHDATTWAGMNRLQFNHILHHGKCWIWIGRNFMITVFCIFFMEPSHGYFSMTDFNPISHFNVCPLRSFNKI